MYAHFFECMYVLKVLLLSQARRKQDQLYVYVFICICTHVCICVYTYIPGAAGEEGTEKNDTTIATELEVFACVICVYMCAYICVSLIYEYTYAFVHVCILREND